VRWRVDCGVLGLVYVLCWIVIEESAGRFGNCGHRVQRLVGRVPRGCADAWVFRPGYAVGWCKVERKGVTRSTRL